uniref:Capsid protein n=1 Tax=ssDNA virus sp. TaxID=2593122 RepID=A0A894JV69_9VIRU|nr:capsid protein [ssDNA virus sp.]
MLCKVSETYDLSTQLNKMGLLAIHTPDLKLFARHWGGAMMNHKKFRFVGCDVTMACASMLPADPLQIGTEAGDLAPQDMFNPILYKAVSNDTYNNLLNYMQLKFNMFGSSPPAGSLSENSIVADNSTVFKDTADVTVNQWDMYYGLLSNTSGWKKAMPQAGLEMKGLYPIVYSIVSNIGNSSGFYSNGNDSSDVGISIVGMTADQEVVSRSGAAAGRTPTVKFRGPSMRMPPLPTKVLYDDSTAKTTGSVTMRYSEPTYPVGGDVNDNVLPLGIPYIPPCYVGVIILPPAKLNKLYYRMKVTWTIELTEPESIGDVTNWTGLATIGAQSYGTDYATQSKAVSTLTAMVDTESASIQKVMEGV